jgi:putative peptidoglycan lipid II flippase
MSISQLNVLIDKTIASAIFTGGISALNYANKLNLFIYSVFVIPIVTVMYPSISKMSANGDKQKFKKAIIEAINAVNIFVIPASVGAVLHAKPIITLLFERGAFDSDAVVMTANALLFYSIGMVAIGLREVLSRAFYSLQNTKTPMINATIGVMINIIFNLILSKFMGISGLALATSISAIFTMVLMFISFRTKFGPFGLKNVIITSLKITIASLIMGLFSKLGFNFFSDIFSQNFSLILAMVIGVITYFITLHFMKIEDIDVIKNVIKDKIRTRRYSSKL